MAYILNIDSGLRSSGTNESFQVNLQPPIPGANIKRFSVLDAVIPLSFYYITSSTNTFIVSIAGSNTITITPGNYTAASLAQQLQTQLNTIPGSSWTVTYSSSTYKFTFTESNLGTKSFIFTNNPAARRWLGFSSNTPPSFATTITSDQAIQLYPNSILVHSSLPGRQAYTALGNNNLSTYYPITQSDVILRIPITNSPGDILTYQPSIENIRDDVSSYLSSISFYLTDDSNQPINLNYLPWTITIKLYTF